jgi:predicted hydrocarbon binding protein
MDEDKSKQMNEQGTGEMTHTPDRLNAMGVLTRREIEARIVAPLLEALGEEFGPERVLEVARDVIVNVARQQGAQLAESMGGSTLAHFAESMEAWKKGNAIEMEVLEQTDDVFAFNITRCRYAEMYADLGIPELGAVLSCNRDYALIEGFNANVTLTRTQTIMEGAPHCDFRYKLKE